MVAGEDIIFDESVLCVKCHLLQLLCILFSRFKWYTMCSIFRLGGLVWADFLDDDTSHSTNKDICTLFNEQENSGDCAYILYKPLCGCRMAHVDRSKFIHGIHCSNTRGRFLFAFPGPSFPPLLYVLDPSPSIWHFVRRVGFQSRITRIQIGRIIPWPSPKPGRNPYSRFCIVLLCHCHQLPNVSVPLEICPTRTKGGPHELSSHNGVCYSQPSII